MVNSITPTAMPRLNCMTFNVTNSVVGIEHVPELANQSWEFMIANDFTRQLLQDVKINIHQVCSTPN